VLAGFRSRLTYANVASSLALFVALSTGGAYAANTIGSSDVIDESLLSQDIKNGEVKNTELAPESVLSPKIGTGAVQNSDLGNGAVGTSKLGGNAVTGGKVAADTLQGADILESSLGVVPHSSTSSEAFGVIPGSVGTSGLASGAVTRAKTADPELWHYIGDPGEPAFQNGWSNYDAAVNHTDAGFQHAAYMKDSFGVVHLRGLVKGGTIGQPFFTLQGTYCPWFFHAFPVLSNNALGRVTVQFVQPGCGVYADFGSNGWISLEGVSYKEWQLDARAGSAASASAPTKTVHHGLTRSTR
jgi:hypothetical protein